MVEQDFQRLTLLTGCAQKLDGQKGANDDFYDCYGFARHAPWRRYGCYEDAFHTLPAFLDGTLPGSPFDSVKSIQDYQEIIENADGTCGQKTHEAVKNILMNQSKGGR